MPPRWQAHPGAAGLLHCDHLHAVRLMWLRLASEPRHHQSHPTLHYQHDAYALGHHVVKDAHPHTAEDQALCQTTCLCVERSSQALLAKPVQMMDLGQGMGMGGMCN
jgi:hypothetical protein